MVGAVADGILAPVGGGLHQDVLGQVDDDRAGAAAPRHMERLVHRAGEVLGVLHQVVVLGAGPGDADRVGLLEGVVADHVGRHLAGQADDRHGVHERVGEAGDGVGGAGSGGDQDAADLAGRAGIALGGMDGGLLVADEDVAQLVLLEDGVVDRQHSPAGIAEDHLYALLDQRLEHHLRAGHRLGVDGGRRGCRCGHRSNSGCSKKRLLYRWFVGRGVVGRACGAGPDNLVGR